MWMQRCFQGNEWPFSVSNTHKPFNVWIQRSLHGNGWHFSASNTHKPFNLWIQRSLHGNGWHLSASNTHKPFNVWMQRHLHDTGWPFSTSNTQNHLKGGGKGVSWALNRFSVPHIPKTQWDFIGDEKSSWAAFQPHKAGDLYWSPSDRDS